MNIPLDLIVSIALKLDILSIRNLCRTSRKFYNKIYGNDIFWMLKFKMDIGSYSKSCKIIWRDYYKFVISKSPLDLLLNGIVMNKKDTVLIALSRALPRDLTLDRSTRTNCLSWASKHGHLDIIKILKPETCYISKDFLYACCRAGHINVIEYFMNEWGCLKDIHEQNERVLSEAVCGGHLDAVKYLINKGANPKVRYSYLLKWSKNRGYMDIYNYLKSILE